MHTVVAEFSITPMVEGKMKPFIDTAVSEIDKAGLRHEVGAVGTTVEGDFDQVLNAIKSAHQAAMDLGAERVVTEIRIDDKKGGNSMAEELEGYR